MTIQDIISHKLTARDFYARLPIVPIGEAWKEPLKLSALRGFSQQYENRGLPEKEEVEGIAKKVRRLYGGGSKNM